MRTRFTSQDLLEVFEDRFKVVCGLGGDLSKYPLTKNDDVHFDTDREKSRAFAEVFTPLHIVDQMLGIMPDKGMTNMTSNVDLCSGYGQFSIRMLRKLYKEYGESFKIANYLQKRHQFAELQLSSCYKLLWIFTPQINLAIGDALQLGKLPRGARGVWYYLESLGEWVNVTEFVGALYERLHRTRQIKWHKGKLFVYDQDKEVAFVHAFDKFVSRLNHICKEPRMNLRNIINTKSGRQALIQFASEAATGIEKNWQENGTPEWVVREMVAAVPEIQTLKRILVLFNIEFLECLIKERGIDPATVDFGYDSEIEGAIAERVYGAHAFSIGDSLLKMQMATSGNAGVYDVVFSNPPYQAHVKEQGNIAPAIYHKIVEIAIGLNPKYISMIIPSRWMTGGQGEGLNKFRIDFLGDKSPTLIVDFEDSNEVFNNVSIEGGVCYFLWSRENQGKVCKYNGNDRNLREFDILVRNSVACDIIRKVSKFTNKSLDTPISAQKPYSILNNFLGNPKGSLKLLTKRNTWVMCDESDITDRDSLRNFYRIAIRAADGAAVKSGRYISETFMLDPNEFCTNTYIIVKGFDVKKEAHNFESYLKTKFVRFMLSTRVTTQTFSRDKFAWVPDLEDYSKVWTDEELYQHFGLTKKEQEHIEKSIKSL